MALITDKAAKGLFTVEEAAGQPEPTPIGPLIGISVTAVLLLLGLWIARHGLITWWRRSRGALAAYVSGALVWWFLVWTYAAVTGGLRNDDRFWSAVIYPPIAAALVMLWVRLFIRRR